MIVVTQSGIPTGQAVGFQVIKAATGSVTIGRTAIGVSERPAGSGNYVATFSAPVEADLYLIVFDWNAGVITPTTSKVEELQVTTSVAMINTGLGEIADYVKAFLGGESFKLLVQSANYGATFVSLAIDVVKNRVMAAPPATVNEGTLPSVVLSYLGKLAALELRMAVYDVWQREVQSQSFGSDPMEIVTYASREAMLKAIFDALLAAIRAEQPLAIELMPNPRLQDSSLGPSINEEANAHVMPDPRSFPRQQDFPYRGGYPPVYANDSQVSERYGP